MITTVRDGRRVTSRGILLRGERRRRVGGARARRGRALAEEDASAGSVARAAFATFVTLAAATMLVESADASKTGGGVGADATIAGDSPRVLATIQGFRGEERRRARERRERWREEETRRGRGCRTRGCSTWTRPPRRRERRRRRSPRGGGGWRDGSTFLSRIEKKIAFWILPSEIFTGSFIDSPYALTDRPPR
jgi:hypothetical protein